MSDKAFLKWVIFAVILRTKPRSVAMRHATHTKIVFFGGLRALRGENDRIGSNESYLTGL